MIFNNIVETPSDLFEETPVCNIYRLNSKKIFSKEKAAKGPKNLLKCRISCQAPFSHQESHIVMFAPATLKIMRMMTTFLSLISWQRGNWNHISKVVYVRMLKVGTKIFA